MGKIKAQKQTIKLKIGKRLSKGDNITNTSFKAKKIKIGDKRCLMSNIEPRQLILQLLSNLKHDSATAKLHKLKRIFAIISSGNKSISKSLNQIFDKIGGLVLDAESPEVRKQTIKLMQLILKKNSGTGHYSHFTYLKALVRSAMTDINAGVRYDSLLVMRLILDWLPEVVCSSHSLLNTMLCLISSRGRFGTAIASSSQSFVSPNEITSTFEYKKSVLKCLADFIHANITASEPDRLETLTEIIAKIEMKEWSLIEHYKPSFTFSKKDFSNDINEINFNFNLNEFQSFVDNLLPILHDNWLEYSPSTFSSMIGTAASYAHSEAMLYILQIISYIGEWFHNLMSKNELEKLSNLKNCSKLLVKIFSYFPYSQEYVHASFVLKINFALCKIYSQFLKKNVTLRKIVLEFLLKQLYEFDGTESEILMIIIPILKDLFCHEMSVSEYEKHLSKLYDFYTDLPPSNECRNEIRNLFTEITLDIMKYRHLHKSCILRSWWMLLPSEFINLAPESFDKTDEMFFEDLLPVCRTSCEFTEAAFKEAFNIIALILSPNEAISAIAINFITGLRPINKEHFICITKTLRNANITSNLIENLFKELAIRSRTINPGFNLTDFLQFMANFAFGSSFSKDEITECTAINGLINYVPFGLSSYTVVPDFTKSHKDIVDVAISHIFAVSNDDLVQCFIQQYMHIFLQKSNTISIDSAIVAFKFASRFLHSPNANSIYYDEILFQLADLTIACYLYIIAAKTACNEDDDFCVDWETELKSLRECTEDVGSAFKVILLGSSFLINLSYSFCVGQLLIQLVGAVGFKPEDIEHLCTILETLKSVHGKSVTEQKWWSQMCKFLQCISD